MIDQTELIRVSGAELGQSFDTYKGWRRWGAGCLLYIKLPRVERNTKQKDKTGATSLKSVATEDENRMAEC
jgi:hypothetical protein